MKISSSISMMLSQDCFKTEKIENVQVRGKVLKIVRENYLRSDLSCHSTLCHVHQIQSKAQRVGVLPKDVTHYLIPFYDVILKYLEVLEVPDIRGIIFLQGHITRLLHEMGKRQYNHALEMVRDIRKGSTVFLNEFHKDTYLHRKQNLSLHQWLNQCTYKVAKWYQEHLFEKIPLVLVSEDQQVVDEFKNKTIGISVLTLSDYLKDFWPNLDSTRELYDSISISLIEEISDDVDRKQAGKVYPGHWSQEQINIGLKSNRLFQGRIQVSKYSDASYLTVTSSKYVESKEDILISSGKMRNRAVHGDLVAVQILPENQWEKHQSGKIQSLGRVVGILQRRWRDYVAVFPEEIQVAERLCTQNSTPEIKSKPYRYSSTGIGKPSLMDGVVVRLDNWKSDSQYPQGHLVRPLGPIGNLETEVAALLLEHSVSDFPFAAGLVSELPNGDKWRVEEEEIKGRRDLRQSHLVFSIDPKGCQDVDDVLSVRTLDDGRLELGVHIADVCHFVQPLTLTDLEAKARSTSVYLADRRFDMLPSVLSTNLCSLRSLQDRYAVSVIWEMEPETGNVLDVWFGRTLIRSSYQLSYETAQAILDDRPPKEYLESIPELLELPEDLQNDMLEVLGESLQQLRHLSRCLHSSRHEMGALEFDSLEVQFEFEQEEGQEQQPKAPKPKQHLEVHETVAECMIAANHWVAKKILESYPQQSLLRLHPSPRPSDLEDLRLAAASQGFDLSTDSNKSLAESLNRSVSDTDSSINSILRLLGTRAMSEARYVSTGSHSDFYHYGLGLQSYTHFTSPIRRYADVLVHRLLLDCCETDDNKKSTQNFSLLSNLELEELCQHMNERHRIAQQVQKASSDLFQALYFQRLSLTDPLRQCEAIVYGIRQRRLLALVPQYGLKGSINLADSKGQVVFWEAEVMQWQQGQITLEPQQQAVIVTTTSGGSQTYRLFDHLMVKIQVQQSRAHAPHVVLELVGRLSAANSKQQGETKSMSDLVQAVKEQSSEAEEAPEIEENVPSNPNSLYKLLLNLRQIALTEN